MYVLAFPFVSTGTSHCWCWLSLKAGPLKMPGRRCYEAIDSRLARFWLTPSRRSPDKRRSNTRKVINTAIHIWTGLAFESQRRFCLGGKKSGEVLRGWTGHVWFGSGRATSARQAHMTSALSTFTASCSLSSVAILSLLFAHDRGNLGWSGPRSGSHWPGCTFSIGPMRRHLALQWLTSLLYKVGVISRKILLWMNGPLYSETSQLYQHVAQLGLSEGSKIKKKNPPRHYTLNPRCLFSLKVLIPNSFTSNNSNVLVCQTFLTASIQAKRAATSFNLYSDCRCTSSASLLLKVCPHWSSRRLASKRSSLYHRKNVYLRMKGNHTFASSGACPSFFFSFLFFSLCTKNKSQAKTNVRPVYTRGL